MGSVVQLRSRQERQQAEAVEEAQRLRSQLVETMERARVALEALDQWLKQCQPGSEPYQQ